MVSKSFLSVNVWCVNLDPCHLEDLLCHWSGTEHRAAEKLKKSSLISKTVLARIPALASSHIITIIVVIVTIIVVITTDKLTFTECQELV